MRSKIDIVIITMSWYCITFAILPISGIPWGTYHLLRLVIEVGVPEIISYVGCAMPPGFRVGIVDPSPAEVFGGEGVFLEFCDRWKMMMTG